MKLAPWDAMISIKRYCYVLVHHFRSLKAFIVQVPCVVLLHREHGTETSNFRHYLMASGVKMINTMKSFSLDFMK